MPEGALQDVILTVGCPKCERTTKRSVRKLGEDRSFICRGCGTAFRVSAHLVHEEIERLKTPWASKAQTLKGRE